MQKAVATNTYLVLYYSLLTIQYSQLPYNCTHHNNKYRLAPCKYVYQIIMRVLSFLSLKDLSSKRMSTNHYGIGKIHIGSELNEI